MHFSDPLHNLTSFEVLIYLDLARNSLESVLRGKCLKDPQKNLKKFLEHQPLTKHFWCVKYKQIRLIDAKLFLTNVSLITRGRGVGGRKKRWGGLGKTCAEFHWSPSIVQRFLDTWTQPELNSVNTAIIPARSLVIIVVHLLFGLCLKWLWHTTPPPMSHFCTVIDTTDILRCPILFFWIRIPSCLVNVNTITSRIQEVQVRISQ